jgi:ABC-type phosphate/phosphonate transport system substrate-binding protein
MSKSWMMLTCMLSLGSVGTSQAHPLDSPDIVYIDGMPCNSACQSYMAWSRQTASMFGHPASTQLSQRSANEVAHRATRVGGKRLKPAAHARIARQAVSIHREMPRAKVATWQPADNAAAKSDVPPDKAGPAASSGTGTKTQEQVAAATALTDHRTAAAMAQAPEHKSNNTGRSNGSETVPPSDAEKIASAPSNNAYNLVALLMARPEIKSVSDLTNKKIAIDDRQSASNDRVRTAIAAAGATEVQLSNGQTRAIDRLISGEVPAAVLTSAYPETSEWFPEIAGFKIFRIPLSPRSSQARLETAGKAATGSDSPPTKIAVSPPMAAAVDPGSRTIQERVAAATALAEHVTAASATPAAQKEASNAEASGRTEALPPSDTEPTASVPTNKTDDLVALMMARPEIKLVSDLTGKEVAIDYQQSGPGTSIRTAIAAAGAVEVQLNEGHTKAIDRLIAGEVPAAILTLVSPEAAEWFPDIPGYRIFRIPLSPRSLKTRL